VTSIERATIDIEGGRIGREAAKWGIAMSLFSTRMGASVLAGSFAATVSAQAATETVL